MFCYCNMRPFSDFQPLWMVKASMEIIRHLNYTFSLRSFFQVTENVGLISVSAMENDYDVFCATFSTSSMWSNPWPMSQAVSLHVSNPSKFLFFVFFLSAVKFVSRSSGGSNLIDTTARNSVSLYPAKHRNSRRNEAFDCRAFGYSPNLPGIPGSWGLSWCQSKGKK